jgi:hypothetical protein
MSIKNRVGKLECISKPADPRFNPQAIEQFKYAMWKIYGEPLGLSKPDPAKIPQTYEGCKEFWAQVGSLNHEV